MLRPTPMKHVRLLVIDEDLPRASLTLAELASFHADERSPEEEGFAGQPSVAYRDIWRQASSRLEKITRLIPLPPDRQPPRPRVIPEEELTATNNWLGSLWETCSLYEEEFRAIDDEERLIREQQSALSNFEGLGIDLGMLRSKTRFLDFYVGLVPYANVRQLEGAVGLADHLLFQYMVTGDDAHVVIVGPSGDKASQLESVLRSAGFRALPIPPELDHEPQVMRAELARRRDETASRREALRQRLRDWSADLIERLASSREVLWLAEPLVRLDTAIRGAGPLARLAGWVPATAVAPLEARLRQTLSLPFDLSSRDPRPDERPLVPTIATRSRLLAPFALLVQQYGIPRYGEIDPTPLFAASFLLMFGTMFGDVGQGAVIAGLAWYFRHTLGRFYLFGVLAGLSSIVFGFVSGSQCSKPQTLPETKPQTMD
ncbi:MAG TPA: V-type ATPase 116kDa subunit family protein, partial [Chromatiaceae bacterium]|nr:V-type ATPase 116kDa subunit family protein [Chromatiaceae bacterium]